MGWINGRDGRRLAALVVDAYGYTCWLCHAPINPDLPRTHPQGLSLDHVTPRSRGGDNSVHNLRPAHLTCNCRRGPRNPGRIRKAKRADRFFER